MQDSQRGTQYRNGSLAGTIGCVTHCNPGSKVKKLGVLRSKRSPRQHPKARQSWAPDSGAPEMSCKVVK